MCYGPEFAAKAVRRWLGRVGVKTLFIEPDSPWENGNCKSFNSALRDELLNGEMFATLTRSPGPYRELVTALVLLSQKGESESRGDWRSAVEVACKRFILAGEPG